MAKRSFWKMLATLAAFGLAFALVLTGCPTDGNGNDPNNNLPGDNQPGNGNGENGAHLGGALNLTGQVWEWTHDEDTGRYLFTQFTGSRTLTSELLSGTGGIVNGQFSFTIGRPQATGLVLIGESEFMSDWSSDWAYISVSPNNAMIAGLWLKTPNGEELWREHRFSTETATGWYYHTREIVYHIFADRDVAISAARTQWGIDARAFDITLREGWNTIHVTITDSSLTMYAANPDHLKWVLNYWNGYAFSEDLEPPERMLPDRSSASHSIRIRR